MMSFGPLCANIVWNFYIQLCKLKEIPQKYLLLKNKFNLKILITFVVHLLGIMANLSTTFQNCLFKTIAREVHDNRQFMNAEPKWKILGQVEDL